MNRILLLLAFACCSLVLSGSLLAQQATTPQVTVTGVELIGTADDGPDGSGVRSIKVKHVDKNDTFEKTVAPPQQTADFNTKAFVPKSGLNTFEMTAQDDTGNVSAPKVLKITIGTPPTITSPASAQGTVNALFEYIIAATSPGAVTYSMSSNADLLPPGITFQNDRLKGTPTAAGTFPNIKLMATNADGSATINLTITILSGNAQATSPKITSGSTIQAIVGDAISYVITATGTQPIVFAITKGSLPSGLTLDGSEIKGMANAAGVTKVTITASNAAANKDSLELMIDIKQPGASFPPEITSNKLVVGKVAQEFTHLMTAVGTAPIFFALTTGDLPHGLNMNGAVIFGIPTQVGTYRFTITASNDTPKKAVQEITVVITPTGNGSGIDSDGDGVPDEIEVTLGTSPTNPNDSPVPPGPVHDLNVTKLSIKMNFSKTVSRDSMQCMGTIPVEADIVDGQQIVFSLGGMTKLIAMDLKGNAKPKSKELGFKLSIKKKKGEIVGPAKFKLNCKQQDLAPWLFDEGLIDADIGRAIEPNADIDVFAIFENKLFKKTVPLMYSARSGRSGAAKSPRNF